MELTEKIYNDLIWVHYESGEEVVMVYPRCTCGRYLKHGKVTAGLIFTGWICKKCGEIKPFYLID